MRTLPSMNLTTARMMQVRPLMMDTLNRKLSWGGIDRAEADGDVTEGWEVLLNECYSVSEATPGL